MFKGMIVGAVALFFALSIPSHAEDKNAHEGMIFIKGGCFQMGDLFNDGGVDEKPVHEVCLTDYYLDATLVTQEAYEKWTGKNPSKFKGCPDCPVDRVTWESASKYCKTLDRRLPTEAEWEYAAREGGRKVRFGTGNDTISSDDANYDAKVAVDFPYARPGVFRGKTTPVRMFPPNALGLYDMAGNLWQMMNDYYAEYFYKHSPKDNPQGPPKGQDHLIRGGSWILDATNARAANRYIHFEGGRGDVFGFRCAK